MKSRNPRRVKVKIGRQEFTKIGAREHTWRDIYHLVLEMSWFQFFFITILTYLSINLFFAFLYYTDEGGVARTDGRFINHLFFSIETLSTVGYGEFYPVSSYAHTVSAIEVFFGLLGVALLTGLIFARFSKPRARIRFSKVGVVTSYEGVPTFMVRVANERHNLILEADVTVTFVRTEKSSEGHVFRRQYDLELVRNHTAAFTLSWSILHRITQHSPLHGYDDKKLADVDGFLLVSIKGLDDTLNQTVHARGEYEAEQIHFGERFVDVLLQDGDTPILDLRHFDETLPD